MRDCSPQPAASLQLVLTFEDTSSLKGDIDMGTERMSFEQIQERLAGIFADAIAARDLAQAVSSSVLDLKNAMDRSVLEELKAKAGE